MPHRPSTRVGIITGEEVPHLTEDGRALLTEMRGRELSAKPVLWTNLQVDWSTFDAALVRSCWEYHTRPDAFRNWLEFIEDADVALLNPADAIRWNIHKFYLRDLAEEGVSILPTAWIEQSSDTARRAVSLDCSIHAVGRIETPSSARSRR
jgi:hypothetical protein